MSATLLTLALRREQDVVAARRQVREVAARLGFDTQGQTRIATAVSEIARNAFRYATGGHVTVAVDTGQGGAALVVRVADTGPGIADVAAVLEGRFRSSTGMGMGIAGTRRLMDDFAIDSAAGRGTVVRFAKRLPPAAEPPDDGGLAALAQELVRRRVDDPMEEVQQQNQELLLTLDALRAREQELLRLNQELEDTNRGVVALYKELDENVEQLRRSNALRAQVVTYLSHDFRTPLDSILALTRLLRDRVDGDLTEEQERQVEFVQHSARDLLTLVDDLLDTARLEAGHAVIRAGAFRAEDLLGALRATLRPLAGGGAVSLVVEEPAGLPPLHTDEAKVSRILRNLVSNALKFTERGEVRVRARAGEEEGWVAFEVSDTGIGVPPADQERIFRDFAQVDGPLQRRARGTGLGLPLSRKLAEILGGSLGLRSNPGGGTVFTLRIPAVAPEDVPARPQSTARSQD